ncbi:lactate dehydrogenase-like 2-hydroxyacid dehydrogenase [Kitasatospora gansuensis]|uniref:Lactate dehydrogenase-like 2-hydroxyacid dehydrogenase n=1 Tax=Kitasatospora gansuensis TaxID=258050 RepID=A0A7W7WLJ5_9ACTN|nr:lactate dehydrogenase-like 2-hydroxyacid dehydrogenase [Kitasatospora gansuensis]
MEIIAYGVQADEQPLLRAAFETSHQLRTLAVFLNADTAPPTSASPLPGSPTTPPTPRPSTPGPGIGDDVLARLISFPQVLVTSHQAYFTHTAVGQVIDATVRNIEDFEAGRRNENTLVPNTAV